MKRRSFLLAILAAPAALFARPRPREGLAAVDVRISNYGLGPFMDYARVTGDRGQVGGTDVDAAYRLCNPPIVMSDDDLRDVIYAMPPIPTTMRVGQLHHAALMRRR